MSIDAPGILNVLVEAGPVALALQDEKGILILVSKAFERVTGLAPEGSTQEMFHGRALDTHSLQLGDHEFEVWAEPWGAGCLVVLRDRSEIAKMEDQLWEQQTRLSKVYSELSVKNQALTATLEELHRHEEELSVLNKNLQRKVEEQLQQLERSNKLKRYLSPEVANSIISSDSPELTTHKRLLTIFFADVSSFDELASGMESEEVIELLSEYRREMTKILFENGGTLDKFITGRIMGFFGDPVPQEDHAVRAVRAGIQMRDCLRANRQKWFPASDTVDLQVGIHTGYATVGNVGSEYRVDYTVIGKNVAMASALQQEAKPGQVLLSGKTYEFVKDLFDVENLQLQIKGSSRSITVLNVIGEKSQLGSMASTRRLSEAPKHSQDIVGCKLGPYVVVEKLGEGGMGIVYKAVDESLRRTVALKVLASELAADAKFVARFKREAQALASLNSPHIAQIYYIGEDVAPLFFAMEFIEGPTLRRVISDQGALPLRRVFDLVTQMARGLQVAAENGIIHRDIKPDNVMLTLKGQVKLTDFGLVKSFRGDAGMTSRGMVLGTPLYMSPEQTRGEDLDLRSDIYSLGATFFHMLMGSPPFQGNSALAVMRQHEDAELPPLNTMPGTVSASVYHLLRKMMAKKPGDRFDSYDSLINALDAC